MAPDVTFIVAAYNAQETISAAIESALAQTGVAVEVIVADDCSNDRTVAIASAFDRERVRVTSLERNQGPGGARNAALDLARGHWIAILDSDDVVVPNRSLKMIERAENTGSHVAVDNILIADNLLGEHTLAFPRHQLEQLPELTLANFIASNMLFNSTYNFGYFKPLFRRSFLTDHKLRYSSHLRIGEDYLFLAMVLASDARCVVEPEAGYIYHRHPGSISQVLRLEHVAAMLAADRDFVASFELDAAAAVAQRRRTKNLMEAASFLSLVDHIKQKEFSGIVAIALRNPRAFRHLGMPIKLRFNKWREAVTRGTGATSPSTQKWDNQKQYESR